jgi:hypothetical protein
VHGQIVLRGLFLGEIYFLAEELWEEGGACWSKEACTLWQFLGNAKCRILILEDLASC